MKQIYLLFYLAFCTMGYGQEVQTIAATVLDLNTHQPVEFVNIGFLDKGVGTVSNASGNFSLTWDVSKTKGEGYLEFSSIGYETKKIPITDLASLTSYEAIVYLIPTAYDLAEVLIVNEKRGFEKLGSSTYGKDRVGYWMNLNGLGGEIATKVRVDKANTLLHSLTFNVLENKADSLLVRVKVYDYHRGRPDKNLVTQNIYHTISIKEGEETIPLKKYNIIAQEDIVVSLELIEVYGETIYFEVATSPYKGTSYTREQSMDKWKTHRDVGIAFNLLSSYPANAQNKTIAVRKKPDTLDLYWDASIRMQSRNITEELKLISKYINHVENVKIRVVTFSKARFEEKIFNIKNGRSKDLETYLESTNYNGASDFSEVLKNNDNGAEVALVFTNGETVLTPLQTAISIPVFCINSRQKANHSTLQDVSYTSGGQYLNLTSISTKDALNYLQMYLEDERTYRQQEENTSGYLYGVVYNENDVPLQGATVKIKNTFYEVETEANGRYMINAVSGDVLTISAFGMYRKDTVVGQLKKLHIPLKTNRELLEEVVLETKTTSDKIAEEATDTPFGSKKRGAIGFSVANRFTSEDISVGDISIADVLSRMPGVELRSRSTLAGAPGVYIFQKTFRNSFQNGGETYPVLILDDILYDQMAGQRLPPINPQMIDNIVLLKTAQATVRYGQLAAYGAIVIETKQQAQFKQDERSSSSKKETPSATISGNDYIEDTSIRLVEKEKSSTVYIKKIERTASLEAAKQLYHSLQKEFGDRVPFYVETASYFEALDANFAESIRSNILALAPSNSKALRALAFEYEAIGKTEDARKLYEHILYLKPKDVQSYLDMARLSVETGNIEIAEAVYTQLLYNEIPNVNATELQQQVFSGMKHLVANHKSKLNFNELPKEFLEVGYKEDIRIVFDWSNSATDFELEFVNPENKYFTFSHTIFENRSFLEKEIKDGFSSKEFIIDNKVPGRWLINIEHFGEEETENPTYLKYTLYRNYGLPSETKEIKVINLSKYTKKITLDKIVL